jgi:hypothetical protein
MSPPEDRWQESTGCGARENESLLVYIVKQIPRSSDSSPQDSRPGAAPSPVLLHRLERLVWFAAGFTFLVGLLVSIGWLLEMPRLITGFVGDVPMMPVTAIGLLLAAGSLATLLLKHRAAVGIGKGLAAIVLVLGLVTSADHLLPFVEVLHLVVKRPSAITAFSFVGVGVALLLGSRRPGAILLSDLSIMVVLLFALLGLAGYTYGARGPTSGPSRKFFHG